MIYVINEHNLNHYVCQKINEYITSKMQLIVESGETK